MVTVTVTLESTPGPAMISAEARFDDVVGLVLHRQAALAQPGRCNDAAMPTNGSVIRVGPAAYRDPGLSAPVAGREEEKVLFKFSSLALERSKFLPPCWVCLALPELDANGLAARRRRGQNGTGGRCGHAAGARNFSSQSRNGHENPGFLPAGLRKPLRQSAFVGAVAKKELGKVTCVVTKKCERAKTGR